VTVVTTVDQEQLLAKLSANLRQQAKDKLQEELSKTEGGEDKRVLEEALTEEITKKTYNKEVNDQVTEFNLNLTVKYKGTAYSEEDLRAIVSQLVSTNVPEGFELNLAETETQADVSRAEKDGRLIFLARFKAKLIPKIDTNQLKKQIKGKTPVEAANILKGNGDILGSDIKLSPPLPLFLQRLPVWERNIKVEVGLK